jgi:predicted AAA+ superfamily ATPase
VRSPKIYIRDTGTLHRLLGIGDRDDLLGNPKIGASWKGFVIEQILMMDNITDPWFWATHAGAELDLLVNVDGRRLGLEIKRTARPTLTPSIRSAMETLDLDHLIVIHAGEHRFPLSTEVDAIPVAQLLTDGLAAG